MSAISIGRLAQRTGLSTSAIRFYERRGLVRPVRTPGGRREFQKADIRRLSFLLIAQRLGLKLTEIAALLDQLPEARTPTREDWAAISTGLKARIEARIATLNRLNSSLDSCIGCGCLSLDRCALHNPEDRLAELGPGPVWALGTE